MLEKVISKNVTEMCSCALFPLLLMFVKLVLLITFFDRTFSMRWKTKNHQNQGRTDKKNLFFLQSPSQPTHMGSLSVKHELKFLTLGHLCYDSSRQDRNYWNIVMTAKHDSELVKWIMKRLEVGFCIYKYQFADFAHFCKLIFRILTSSKRSITNALCDIRKTGPDKELLWKHFNYIILACYTRLYCEIFH